MPDGPLVGRALRRGPGEAAAGCPPASRLRLELIYLLCDAQCLLELQREAAFLWSSELENISTLCFRAFEGSNSNVRVAVAKLLGTLLAAAVQPPQPAGNFLQLTGSGVRSG